MLHAISLYNNDIGHTVYPKKYAHGFVVFCFVVVMQSFIMNSHEAFIHIHQGCFAGTGAIVRLPQCQWSKLDGYGKISQCITTTKHSKAKTVCIFLGKYCILYYGKYPVMTELWGDYCGSFGENWLYCDGTVTNWTTSVCSDHLMMMKNNTVGLCMQTYSIARIYREVLMTAG